MGTQQFNDSMDTSKIQAALFGGKKKGFGSAPNDSYKAKADSLATSLQTVATQQKFEADHFAMHSANMATADAECQALKTHVRAARAAQEAGGNQYPPFKIYGGDKK